MLRCLTRHPGQLSLAILHEWVLAMVTVTAGEENGEFSIRVLRKNYSVTNLALMDGVWQAFVCHLAGFYISIFTVFYVFLFILFCSCLSCSTLYCVN